MEMKIRKKSEEQAKEKFHILFSPFLLFNGKTCFGC